MSRVAVSLFGDFAIRIGEDIYTRFCTSNGQTLLAYLILVHDTPVRRELLFDLLWPGLPQ